MIYPYNALRSVELCSFEYELNRPRAVIDFKTQNATWEIKQSASSGRLTFYSPSGGAKGASFKFDPQAKKNLLRVGVAASDIVEIDGRLFVKGSQLTPDYVFEPGYPLESIEEHAELMWESKHLPALPGAAANEGGVDIVGHQYGTLEELEIAHIYISQLNESLKAQAEEFRKQDENLQEQNARIIQLEMALAEVLRLQSSDGD